MSERDMHLDGLRGFAAFIVVVAHGIIAFDFALYTGEIKNSLTTWDIFVSGAPLLLPMAGNLSVCIFFALSGYVLSQSFSTTSLGVIALLLKRYIRFTLPILAACLISYTLLVNGSMENHQLAAISKSNWLADQMQQAPSFKQALKEGLYLSLTGDVPFSTSYDSSLWTMSIEFCGSVILICIFKLPEISMSCPEKRRRFQIFLLTALGGLGFLSYIGLFAFGAMLNLTRIHRKISSRLSVFLLGLGFFLGSIPYSSAPWDIVRPFIDWQLPIVRWIPYAHSSISFCHSIGAILILIATDSLFLLRRMLSNPFFQFLGQISFPLYLIHIPLLMSVISRGALLMLHSGLKYAHTMVLSLSLLVVVSVLLATILLFICERPSITLSGRIAFVADNLVKRITALYRDACNYQKVKQREAET